MKRNQLLLGISLLGMVFLLSSCLRKDLDIDVDQVGCAFFHAEYPTYEVIVDPVCSDSPMVASYAITFNYGGGVGCLDKIVIDNTTLIEDEDGNVIEGATYQAEYFDSLAEFTVDSLNKTVTFRFDVTFQTLADVQRFNDAYIVFHASTYEGRTTRYMYVRIVGECSAPPGVSGTPYTTIDVRKDSIKVKLWDDGDSDGDLISVYLNGEWVLNRYLMLATPKSFNWPIVQGADNDLTLVALNQGRDGPIDCSITINNWHSYLINIEMDKPAVIRIR